MVARFTSDGRPISQAAPTATTPTATTTPTAATATAAASTAPDRQAGAAQAEAAAEALRHPGRDPARQPRPPHAPARPGVQRTATHRRLAEPDPLADAEPVERQHLRAEAAGKKSIADLLKDLRDESQQLFRQEVELVKAEVGQKVSRAKSNAIWLAAGGVLLAAAGLFALLTVAWLIGGLLALVMPNVLAVCIGLAVVALVTGVVGYVLLKKALDGFAAQSVTPEHTLNSLKEDAQWLTNKVK